MEQKADSERPPDSDFQQQNLKAWQPLLTPMWVICTFLFIGCVFMPIGFIILNASNSVTQIEKQYDTAGELGDRFEVELTITNDMKAPIYFYYKLDKFYQNHRQYVKSRSDTQLRGEIQTKSELSSCEPLLEYEGKLLYPCGLIANSYFNNVFDGVPPRVNRDGSPLDVDWTDRGIAWESDKEYKFKEWADFDDATMSRVGPSNVTLNHTREDFMVWMRTAGLPNFKKLRYIINSDLMKDDVFTVTVDNLFDVSQFDGKKHIVLSTTSWLGGKNDFLGLAYIYVSIVCFVLALAFAIRHKFAPRPLGDMRYFNWYGAPVDSSVS